MSLLFVSTLQARETDQYLVWDVELPDSAAMVNSYLEEQMSKVLSSKKIEQKSCQAVTLKFFHRLVGTFTFSQFSIWAQNHKEMEQYRYPDLTMGKYEYVDQSIFGGSGASPIIRWFIGLAPTINVNGVYFGTDKLGHISYMGNKYFKKYLKFIKKGMSEGEAVKTVLEGGFASEVMLGGFYGTSSPSDLEANYQGLQLALDMCAKENPILSKVDGRWQADLARLKIENYVAPEFDESYYPIIFGDKTWNKSAKSRIMRACSAKDLSLVKLRFEDYRKRFVPSPNMLLIQAKMKKDKKFNNQKFNFQKVCGLDF
jgi:hypothetical protein